MSLPSVVLKNKVDLSSPFSEYVGFVEFTGLSLWKLYKFGSESKKMFPVAKSGSDMTNSPGAPEVDVPDLE